MDSAQQQRFTDLTLLCQEILDNMQRPSYIGMTDVVEDGEIDVDEGGFFIHLEGDFVQTMLRYLSLDDEASPNYNRITMKINTDVLDKFEKNLGELRHGY